MPRDAFVLKTQRDSCQPNCARKVSGLSRNGPQARVSRSALTMLRVTGPRLSMNSGIFFPFLFSFVALLPVQAYSYTRLERFILLKPQRTFVILGCNEKIAWKSLPGRNVFNVFFDVSRLSRKVPRGLRSSLPDK